MEEKLLYLTTNLSKNTIGIIIGYLTDPPVLPYLVELQNRTSWIYNNSDWFYDNYYICSIDSYLERVRGKSHITMLGNTTTSWWWAGIKML